MKIAYTPPSKSEVYLIDKNEASRIVRSRCPELELLAFQTMHGPKMSADVPYLATFTPRYIRVLSVRPEFALDDLRIQFHDRVLPYICDTVERYRKNSYFWPVVVVAIGEAVHEVSCSDGGLFPSRAEIVRKLKAHPGAVCTFDVARYANGTRASNQSP